MQRRNIIYVPVGEARCFLPVFKSHCIKPVHLSIVELFFEHTAKTMITLLGFQGWLESWLECVKLWLKWAGYRQVQQNYILVCKGLELLVHPYSLIRVLLFNYSIANWWKRPYVESSHCGFWSVSDGRTFIVLHGLPPTGSETFMRAEIV